MFQRGREKGRGDEREGGEGWGNCMGGRRILMEPYLGFCPDSNCSAPAVSTQPVCRVSSPREPRPSKGGAGSKTAVKAVVSGFLGALPWLRKQGWAVEGEV